MAELMSAPDRSDARVATFRLPEWASLGDDVARAVGIVAAQAGCSAECALELLRGHGARYGRNLQTMAVATIDRKLRFG